MGFASKGYYVIKIVDKVILVLVPVRDVEIRASLVKGHGHAQLDKSKNWIVETSQGKKVHGFLLQTVASILGISIQLVGR